MLQRFKYDSCVKLFTHVGNVRRHIKTVHEGHKDSKCDSYGKSFSLLPNSVLLLGSIFTADKFNTGVFASDIFIQAKLQSGVFTAGRLTEWSFFPPECKIPRFLP